jgi:tRNA pseudouridine38-40 synthase
MTTVRLDLAYHGAGFAGWATQPGLRTVQGELEAALEEVLGESTRLTVAGRTDAGVHAWGQVASLEADGGPPTEALAPALNALSGEDVAILSSTTAPKGFDARRDARSRTYCYRVLSASAPNPFEREFALHWPRPIEIAPLRSCATALAGKHDFTAFTPTQTGHVHFEREVMRAEWLEVDAPLGDGTVFEFWVEADAFMRNMVRVLVGTMLEVAGGRRSPEDFVRLLGGADRSEAGETAPAHGLHLASVRY